MRTFSLIVLSIALHLFVIGSFMAHAEDKVELDLKGRTEVTVDYPIRVYVSYEAKQLTKPNGIKVAIAFQNNSEQHVKFVGGSDFCTTEILDIKGWPIAPKEKKAPAFLVNNPSTKGKVDMTMITLMPGKIWQETIEYPQVIENAPAVFSKNKDAEKLVQLPASVYRLKLHCTIAVINDDESKSSRSLVSDYFEISYGQQ